MKRLLLVHYGPGPTSITARVVGKLLPALKGKVEVTEVDLLTRQPSIFNKESMAAYVKRNYKGESLNEIEGKTLTIQGAFTEQVLNTDIIVLVTPMYNFFVPAAVKAWIDNICQAKKTFQYTQFGLESLAKVEKAIVVPISGGTLQDSAGDFLTPYLKYIFKFIGVKEIVINGIMGSRFLGDAVNLRIDEIIKEIGNKL